MVENVESNPEAIRNFGNNTPPSNIFKKQPTNLSSEEIRPMEFQYFGKTRIVVLHVLPDYAALYNQSSNSSQNLTNPSTRIKNGYGIFTGLNADTLWLNVKKNNLFLDGSYIAVGSTSSYTADTSNIYIVKLDSVRDTLCKAFFLSAF